MIRKYFLLFIIFIACSAIIYSQNKLSVNLGYGNYLSNSENSTKIMGDSKFRSYLMYGFTYERENIFGHNISFEYSYNEITKEGVLIFARTGPDSPAIIDYFGADVSLKNHNFDLNYIGSISKYFSYGLGPSFVITNRIISLVIPSGESNARSLYDKLASSGLGANGFLQFRMPLDDNKNHFFVTSKVKLRYTYSIWFDKGIRNLDDYHQKFLTAELSAGIGYAF